MTAQIIRSTNAVRCPDCGLLKLSFVIAADGARCTECHGATTTGTRPADVARADWGAVSRSLGPDLNVVETTRRRTVVNSKWIFLSR